MKRERETTFQKSETAFFALSCKEFEYPIGCQHRHSRPITALFKFIHAPYWTNGSSIQIYSWDGGRDLNMLNSQWGVLGKARFRIPYRFQWKCTLENGRDVLYGEYISEKIIKFVFNVCLLKYNVFFSYFYFKNLLFYKNYNDI